MILYKYRRDSEYTEKIFTTRRVRLSTNDQLDDPFECSLQEIAKDWIAAKVKEMKQAQLAGFIAEARRALSEPLSFFGQPPSDVAELLETLHHTRDFDLSYKHYRDFMTRRVGSTPSNPDDLFNRLDEQLNEVGIFSMSEVPDNQLMWAHYTEDQKGLCLGFAAIDGSRLADDDHCFRVNYSDSMPKMGDGFQQQLSIRTDETFRPQISSRIAMSDPAVRAAISTKPLSWSYQREWRYVEAKGGDYPLPGPLTEVVFGLKCPPERREHYVKLVLEFVSNEVSFYEMRKLPNTKSIERVRVPPASSCVKSTSTTEIRKGDGDYSEEEIALLIEHERFEEAVEALDPLIEKDPNAARLWHLKGTALGKLGDAEGAVECFDRCTQLHPNVFVAWYGKGVALSELKRHQDAVEAYERARALEPNDASTAFNLGVELLHLEKVNDGLLHLRHAERLGHPRAQEIIEYVVRDT